MQSLCRKRKYCEANKDKPAVLTTYHMEVGQPQLKKTEKSVQHTVFIEPFNSDEIIPPVPNEKEAYDDENYDRDYYDLDINDEEPFKFGSFEEYLK